MSELSNYMKYSVEQAQGIFESRLIPIWRNDTRWNQISSLMDFLMKQSNFRDCPASTKYHLCVPGGLFAHSVTVADLALNLAPLLFFFQGIAMTPQLMSSIALCAFCHDLGKLGGFARDAEGKMWQIARYEGNILKTTGKLSESQPYKYNDQLMAMSGGVRSLRLVDKFVDLYESEAQAILAHDGQYVDANKEYSQKETPLLLLTHFVDMWVGRIVEGNINVMKFQMEGVFSPK